VSLSQDDDFFSVKGGVSMTTIERLSVVVPADGVAGPKQGQWTYADYAAIPEDGHRYEVVSGVLYMSPSPNVEHQRIAKMIVAALSRVIDRGGFGEVFQSPLDVELSDGNVVQPDVFVLLEEHGERVMETRIVGAPDLVVEIASPGTARHDLGKKLDVYACASVPEYWIVTPGSKTVEVLVLKDGLYSSLGLFHGRAVLPSHIVPMVSVRVEQFFPFS
jgi:Uma2 family endonuclease